jgi:ubiquinone/menaquinone biosynthesis C-methylase UbiE
MNPIASSNFIDPEKIIKQLNIGQGNVIADFGCGSGYFSLPLAQKVGDDGKVYCLDVLTQALETVASKAKIMGITTLETSRVNLEKLNGSKLPDGSVDWVIMKDMLFQNKNKEIILSEAKRVLRPGGKLLIVEWNDHSAAVGPESNVRVSQDEVLKLTEAQNMKKIQEIEAGDFHYSIVFAKPLA